MSILISHRISTRDANISPLANMGVSGSFNNKLFENCKFDSRNYHIFTTIHTTCVASLELVLIN
jgi:hypothetical protein